MSELIKWVVMLGPLAVGLIWGMRIHNQLIRRRNFVDDAWSGIEVQLKRRQNVIPALWKTLFAEATDEIEKSLPDLDHRLSPAEAMDAVQRQDSILQTIVNESPGADPVSAEALSRLQESLADIESTLRLEPRHFGAIWGLGMILGKQREFQRAIEAFERLLEIKPNAQDARPRIELLKQELAKQAV